MAWGGPADDGAFGRGHIARRDPFRARTRAPDVGYHDFPSRRRQGDTPSETTQGPRRHDDSSTIPPNPRSRAPRDHGRLRLRAGSTSPRTWRWPHRLGATVLEILPDWRSLPDPERAPRPASPTPACRSTAPTAAGEASRSGRPGSTWAARPADPPRVGRRPEALRRLARPRPAATTWSSTPAASPTPIRPPPAATPWRAA